MNGYHTSRLVPLVVYWFSLKYRLDADNRKCAKGYYCGAKKTNEQPCPKGTYSNLTGQEYSVSVENFLYV